MTRRVLMIGHSTGLIDALARIAVDAPQVYLLVEPSVLETHPGEFEHPIIAEIRTGRFIFSDEAVEVGIDWHASVGFDVVCWIELGHPEKALTILEQGLSDWSADSRRDLGMGLARLSTVHAGVGSWSEAVEVAGYAATIVADTGSHRTLGQLRTTATVLHEAGKTGAARELTHQVRKAHRARASHGRSLEWS
ncbi:hypothetical protein [Nocardia sp. NPDC057440]|uniref:hypothetical protein n=1 Tax=Nocardia sp. NPDC057440 TaxID=3346134 RepID=UPI00366D6190